MSHDVRRVDELITTVELAHLLRLSVRAVQRMRADGQGPVPIILDRGQVRYRRDDVDAYIESRRRSV